MRRRAATRRRRAHLGADRCLTFADERGRPFLDLISRIGVESPADMIARAPQGPVRFQLGDPREWEPGGWFAFQVPGNFHELSHTVRHELAADPRFASQLRGVASPDAFGPDVYLERLLDLGCEVDAWETTYLHVLPGEDPVFTWATGTGARPTLDALPDDLREEFAEEFRTRLRDAYPTTPHGTVLPFRRVFVVARLPESVRG